MIETDIRIVQGSAARLEAVGEASVDLVVTSPPYPMIEMWDEGFARQEPQIAALLQSGCGPAAFAQMHLLLDRIWDELYRVLKPGGIACINIGDATRTLDGDFQLYVNHGRILQYCLGKGFAALPDILWRKPTNAPTKFMGSGMLPVGAYVTYEHEYILILRKGRRRIFSTAEEKARRRRSAFFWEERNRWFSDVWADIRGAGQDLAASASRRRSAAFPFELAYRLVCMFSLKGDVVLDPFVGTGTTLVAAMAGGRHGIGVELDEGLVPVIGAYLRSAPAFVNGYNQQRLERHRRFVSERRQAGGSLKYTNVHYGFEVMTAQERELVLDEVARVVEASQHQFRVEYQQAPNVDFIGAAEVPLD